MTRSTAGSRRRPSGSPFVDAVPRPVEKFVLGDRVTHEQFGLGAIVRVETDIAVDVEFASGRLRIVSPFGKLTKL